MTKRAATHISILTLLIAGSASAQVRDDPLKGIVKVTVDVYLSAANPPSLLDSTRLRTLTELKLRTAGLRVLSAAEDRQDTEANPAVELHVMLLKAENQRGVVGYVFSSRLSVREYQMARRNTAIVPIELWDNSYLNIAASSETPAEIERVVTLLLDDFMNAWLKANPRR